MEFTFFSEIALGPNCRIRAFASDEESPLLLDETSFINSSIDAFLVSSAVRINHPSYFYYHSMLLFIYC